MSNQTIPKTGAEKNPILNKQTILNIILSILIAVSLVSWVRLLNGDTAEVLNTHYPWGIFIVLFLFFECIAAGVLFFVSIDLASKSELAGNKKPLLGVGLIAGLCAGIAIIPDLGSPLVAWRLLFSPNPASPMMLDVWLLGFNIIAGGILYWAITLHKEHIVKLTSWVLVLSSSLLPLGTAWLFTSMLGKPGWVSPSTIIFFLAEALLAGVCVMVLVSPKHKPGLTIQNVLLRVILITNMMLTLGQMGYSLYSAGNSVLPENLLFHGPYAWLFWFQLAACFLVPLLLIFINRYARLATGLVLLGLAIGKYLFIIKGNSFPYLNWPAGIKEPALLNQMDGYQYYPIYFPSLEEWLIVIGIISAGILAINLLMGVLTEEKRYGES